MTLMNRYILNAHSYLIRISILFLLIGIIPHAYSQDSIKMRSWSLNGYLKDMPTFLYTNVNDHLYFENLIHNRLNFKWHISPSFTTAVEVRNRFSAGNFREVYPDYYKSFGFDNGVIDLSWNIFSGNNYVLNSSIDRLWIDYNSSKYQVTFGRQRINWGLNFVWNPNDIFNTYSYLDFDYEEKPGSDAIRFQYYPESTSRVEFTLKAAKDWKMSAAALYRFNRVNWDFQVLGGVMDGSDLVIGGGWSGQIAKGGFRGEASYFWPVKNISDTNGIFVGSLGYDYTFKNSLMLQFEALYNGNPNGNLSTLTSVSQSTESALSAKNPFLSDVSLFGAVSGPVHPLINLSLAGIFNWVNETYIIIPSSTFSIGNNMEILVLAQIFEIYNRELSRAGLNFFFLRYKWSF